MVRMTEVASHYNNDDGRFVMRSFDDKCRAEMCDNGMRDDVKIRRVLRGAS
jgi:hypothetical protein